METAHTSSRIRRCIIITGMSGGGKSSALNIFEDQGFYVIDNLPPALLPQLLKVLDEGHLSALRNGVVAVVDVRSEALLDELANVAADMRAYVESVQVIFIEASDEVLVRRFETTRRRHPLAQNATTLGGIAMERKLLQKIKNDADVVIDTSDMQPCDFRQKILSFLGRGANAPSIIFSSFGYKYGMPLDADYVFDVRFMANPNYVEELHSLSGKDESVQKFLKATQAFGEFMPKLNSLVEFIAPAYANTGKTQFHIAFGCTGGRHRSVAVCENAAEHMRALGYDIIVAHRDIDKGNIW